MFPRLLIFLALASSACAQLVERPAHVFAPDSFWYQPLPADAPLHPNSAGFVADFLRQKEKYFKTVAINTASFASPVYVAPPGAPTVKVSHEDCQKKGYVNKALAEMWTAVPLPATADPATGSDAELTVYQPSTDTMWEFWKMRKAGDEWFACWGGRMQNVSKSSGIWPKYFGTTATGLPFINGQITADELRKGQIDHVIGIALVDAEKSSIFSWPANRSDGANPSNEPNRIPEGLRFRLDPRVDVAALKLHPVGRAVALAAQKYGFVVWDKSGAISLRCENPKTFTTLGLPNPYPEIFNKTPQYNLLKGIPWEKLQFLAMDYGKPAK